MATSLKKILYAEDEIDIQEVARMALEAVGGFEVVICSSGREVLETSRAFQPDLILLDVMMPDMDGPATLKALQQDPELCSTPVIFMTAKVQQREILSYQEMGALDVISKPFDPMELANTIWQIWKRNYE